MKIILPKKLKVGDTIRVIAPARSLLFEDKEIIEIAKRRFEKELGLKVTFGKKSYNSHILNTTSIEDRIFDLNDAFSDNQVKGIIAAIGGYNSNELLDYINWENIQTNPKIFCGFSDITVLNNAIFSQTGLLTYSGPNFITFGQKKYFSFALKYFRQCLMENKLIHLQPSQFWYDDNWKKNQNDRLKIKNKGFITINRGLGEGVILGGNLCSFNLLQGTKYFPSLKKSILFIEDDNLPKNYSLFEFNRNLQSLIQQLNFSHVKGLVIGRFQKKSKVLIKNLIYLIKSKKELSMIPIVANVDFGHTDPKITFPIGGKVKMKVTDNKIEIIF